MQEKYYKKGDRFGKVEMVGHSSNSYHFVCDCGNSFSRSVANCHDKKNYIPLACRDCTKTTDEFSRPKTDKQVREYTPEEQDMIEKFDAESA